MSWIQRQIHLPPRPRGFHLVTDELLEQLPELEEFEVGMAHFFLQHTSAGLTLNENASPSVRSDFENHMNEMVPEDAPYWTHTVEGSDDMPAHVKASMFGAGLVIPIRAGRLGLGTWQGVYLCEHRNKGGARKVLVTLMGER